MIKREEIANLNSCLNKAEDNERFFVLLAGDLASPATIRFWVKERIWLGKNKIGDYQIQEAINCAIMMELDQKAMSR